MNATCVAGPEKSEELSSALSGHEVITVWSKTLRSARKREKNRRIRGLAPSNAELNGTHRSGPK